MKFAVRIFLYVILIVVAAVFFSRFRHAYGEEIERSRELTTPTTAAVESAIADPQALPTNSPPDTQLVATNIAVTPPGNSPESGASNAGAAETRPSKAAAHKADAFIYLGVFVLALLGFGGLLAWEVSHFLGNRAGRSVMAEGWVDRKDPEYEKAEEEWAKGNHLDAIGLMREYLKKNPNEQHVALRIAEIYEKDLSNFLAAALEIEEVLTRKLPREKWGWTAIRLSNLYSGRLNQTAKAMALLDRIVNEYGDTGAAKKARQRLGIPESEPPAATEENAEPEAPEPASIPAPIPEEPASDLPKGFRPKK